MRALFFVIMAGGLIGFALIGGWAGVLVGVCMALLSPVAMILIATKTSFFQRLLGKDAMDYIYCMAAWSSLNLFAMIHEWKLDDFAFWVAFTLVSYTAVFGSAFLAERRRISA